VVRLSEGKHFSDLTKFSEHLTTKRASQLVGSYIRKCASQLVGSYIRKCASQLVGSYIRKCASQLVGSYIYTFHTLYVSVLVHIVTTTK